jgi:hypothetical protein
LELTANPKHKAANETTWLNNPSTQAEISNIASVALQLALNYLGSLLLAPPPGTPAVGPTIDSPQIVAAQNEAVAKLQAQFPDAPKSVLQVKVHDAFVAALAQKYPKQ